MFGIALTYNAYVTKRDKAVGMTTMIDHGETYNQADFTCQRVRI